MLLGGAGNTYSPQTVFLKTTGNFNWTVLPYRNNVTAQVWGAGAAGSPTLGSNGTTGVASLFYAPSGTLTAFGGIAGGAYNTQGQGGSASGGTDNEIGGGGDPGAALWTPTNDDSSLDLWFDANNSGSISYFKILPSQSLTTIDNGWQAYSVRQEIPLANLTNPGFNTGFIRVSFFLASTTDSASLDAAYVGAGVASPAYNFDGSQVRLLFNKGAATVNGMTGATSFTSDFVPFSFNFTSAVSLTVSMHWSGIRVDTADVSSTGSSAYYQLIATGTEGITAPAGTWTLNGSNRISFISKIEFVSSANGNSANVISWTDQASGVVVASSTTPPLYHSSLLNGKPGISFPGGGASGLTASTTHGSFSGKLSVYGVLTLTSAPNWDPVFAALTSSGAAPAVSFISSASPEPIGIIQSGISGSGGTSPQTLAINVPAVTEWQCPAIIRGTITNFGDTAIEIASTVVGGVNYVNGCNYVAPSSGTATSISFYLKNAGAGNIYLGIYDATGAGGSPGNLIAATSGFVGSVGWNTKPVTSGSATITSGTTYWIVFGTTDNVSTFVAASGTGRGFYSFYSPGFPLPSSGAGVGPSYDSSAVALFAAMTNQPSAARKASYNTFIVSLKNAGVWQRLDVLYVFAVGDTQQASLNWIDPTIRTTTTVGTPTFTVDAGLHGTQGSITSYVQTNWTALNYTVNDACAFAWSGTNSRADNDYLFINPTGSTITGINPWKSSLNDISTAVSSATIHDYAGPPADTLGLFTLSRTSSVGYSAYHNASVLGSVNETAIAVPPAPMAMAPGGRTVSMAGFGASLSGQNVTDLYNAFNTYNNAKNTTTGFNWQSGGRGNISLYATFNVSGSWGPVTPYINGNQGGSIPALSGFDSLTQTGIQIGSTLNQGGGNFIGNIHELIVATANTNRQTIEGYLAWKWGLQAGLPSNHPYFSGPPTVSSGDGKGGASPHGGTQSSSAGNYPGGGGAGAGNPLGQGGGAGGFSSKTFNVGQLTVGSNIAYTVGSGGNGTNHGANGEIIITIDQGFGAAPIFIGISYASNTGVVSLPVSIPVGTQNNDLMLAFVSGLPGLSTSAPSGWQSVAASPGVTFGDTVIETASSLVAGSYINGCVYVAPGTGPVRSISVYLQAASTSSMYLGVYDATGAGGSPGNLIAATNGFVGSVGWNTVTTTSAGYVSSGANYWIVVGTTDGQATLVAGSGSQFYDSHDSFLGPLPASGSGFAWSGGTHGIFSLYATIIPDYESRLFSKIANNESGTVTWPTTNFPVIAIRTYRGANTANPINSSIATTVSGLSCSLSALTETTAPNEVYVGFWTNNNQNNNLSAPGDLNNLSTNNSHLAWVSGDKIVSGVAGQETASLAGIADYWNAIGVSIKP